MSMGKASRKKGEDSPSMSRETGEDVGAITSDALTMPMCSAESEKGIEFPLILMGETIFEYLTNSSCPGGLKTRSFVFSGTKVTLYL